MIEKKFVQEGINKAKIEEYLQKELRRANYSHMEFTRTPTSTNIVIWSEKPSLVIGRGGRRINEIIDDFEHKFGIENPQVDAREVEEPDLDANVVAKNVAGWLEKGGHPKRVGYTYLRRVMDAGAVGVQIEISGKLSGSRGRSEKFNDGYVKKCGDTANQYVEESYEKAVIKAGALGVKVKIMKDLPRYMERAIERQKQARQRRLDEAAGKEPEEEEESAEAVAEVDADEIAAMTVGDAKDAVRDEEFDPRAVLKAEQEGKARKTLVEWLENRVEGLAEADDDMEEEPEAEEEADTEAVNYASIVSGTIEDVKQAVKDREIDPEQLLEAEQDNKDRASLTEWLENRIETGEEPESGGADVDYDELVSGTIDDIKEAVEEEGLDPETVLEAEENNKDRITLTEWLENRIEADEEAEETEAADTDYDELVAGTIDDVKTAAEEHDVDYAELLEAEENNKDRVTLKEWLEARIEEDGD